ncbi:hypothetical protein [Nitrosomonas sp.]|uniref:hypothetical protein n=1 Tax=Nitrosomonas sp. TaxID=42353 RepID=UPI001DC8F57A|nr:hypothetical protein [Nitrosomonas sp.]MBX3617998.1 hypothetical protein [Nitrosomonas sp.]
MGLPCTQYSQEFGKESIKFFKESELTLVEAAKRLSLPKGTLKNWVYADKRGKLAVIGKRQKALTVFMCQRLDVSESGFHARSSRPLCKRKQENARLEIEILGAHHRTRETYSAKRLYHDFWRITGYKPRHTAFEHCARLWTPF